MRRLHLRSVPGSSLGGAHVMPVIQCDCFSIPVWNIRKSACALENHSRMAPIVAMPDRCDVEATREGVVSRSKPKHLH
ncbi:hypothetical protein BK187_14830 [Brucella melitensis]|nr:hypothetical protein BK187_14830 [Brucella melitensis]ARY29550.1 hypothetical protein BK219_14830 [Brucella melitensis]ARY39017.1 hypothetical protein BK217_14830 [Brucella melitensis]HAQ31712.1 hypothetical protein [Brucella melitensis]HBW75929.1 hypothetical protein [Brucella melitensis]